MVGHPALNAIRDILANPFGDWSDHLTDNEMAALRYASRGLNYTQIGRRLDMSRQGARWLVQHGLQMIAGHGGPSLEVDELPGYVQDQIKEIVR